MPIPLDGTKFNLPLYQPKRFISLKGKRRRGITTSLFLSMSPINDVFFVGEAKKLSGYCSYHLLYNDNVNLICGAIFRSLKSRTHVRRLKLIIGGQSDDLGEVQPIFVLEKLGLLVYKAEDSSILIVPDCIDSPLVVKAEA